MQSNIIILEVKKYVNKTDFVQIKVFLFLFWCNYYVTSSPPPLKQELKYQM